MGGASVTFGQRGIYGNVGLPGTGLSYRTRLDGTGRSGARNRRSPVPSAPVDVMLALQADGTLEIRDPDGSPVPPTFAKDVVAQHGSQIQQWLLEQCEQFNKGIDRILNLHLETPPPIPAVQFESQAFREPEPEAPLPTDVGFWASLMPGRRGTIEATNLNLLRVHAQAAAQWAARKAEHERRAMLQRDLFHGVRRGEVSAMERTWEAVLEDLEWPRETNVDFDFSGDGSVLFLDVDLPEIEDMPSQHATVAARGLKLNLKPKTETQRRRLYQIHVHAVAFRLIGEVFHALPPVRVVVLSAYSQRHIR